MTYDVPNQSKSLDMQRRSLPQIDLKALKRDKDFTIVHKTMSTKDLTPSQKHFNDEKVLGMIKSGKDFGGVVVSKDGIIIDGHHRAIAAHNISGKVGVLQLSDTAEVALKKLDEKDYCMKKLLHESLTLEDFMAEAKKKTTKPAQEINFEPTINDTLIAGTDSTVNPNRDDVVEEKPKKIPVHEAVAKPITYENTHGNAWTAKAGAKTVGKADAWHDWDGKFVMQNIVVSASHRRKGIATGLYNAIEKQAGKELHPASSLSDDAFHFWKKFRPESVAHDLRHHSEKLMGKSVMKNGIPATIIGVGQHAVTAKYDGKDGTNSETNLFRKDLTHLIGQ